MIQLLPIHKIKDCIHYRFNLGLIIVLTTACAQLHAQANGDKMPGDGNQTAKQVVGNADSTIKKLPSPSSAMLRSLVLPGWGQAYNGRWFKATVIAGAEVGLIANAIVQNRLANNASSDNDKAFYINNRNLSYWWLSGVILYSIIDAYVDAHLFDFDENPELSVQMYKNATNEALATWFFQINIAL